MCVFFFLHDLFDFGENAGIESFVASLILEGRLKDSIPFAFFFLFVELSWTLDFSGLAD